MVALLLCLFAGLTAAALPTGTLIICVESAAELADLDYGEANTGAGSDPYVAVFISGVLLGRTSYKVGQSDPVWNECFTASGGAVHNTDTPISYTVVDVDAGDNEDDVIGVACMQARSHQRSGHWLTLNGPASEDYSYRGRLKVRTYLFGAEAPSSLHFETVRSVSTTPLVGNGPATASVTCPADHEMTSCQCASSGTEPGCAHARVEVDDQTGLAVCHVGSNEPRVRPSLPACGLAANEVPGVTCEPEGWMPPPPGWIAATARCATLGAPPATVLSAASRVSHRDATEVVCASGAMTSCSLATAPGLGTRFEDGDGDGVPECVGYSDGATPVVAQALCAAVPPPSPTGSLFLAQPIETPLSTEPFSIARCPAPFSVAGCSCYSEAGSCRGTSFDRFDPAADAHAEDVCNVTQGTPRAQHYACAASGAEAHAMCVWQGAASALLGADLTQGTCESRGNIVDKAWLPPDWRQRVGVSDDAGNGRMREFATKQADFSSGLLYGMMIMFLSCAIAGLFAALIVVSARQRRVRNMGGAPTMSHARHVVGDVVPIGERGAAVHPYSSPPSGSSAYVAPVPTPIVSSPAVPIATPVSSSRQATAPLMLSDSAAEASHV